MALPDFYAILEVPDDASEKDIRDAYRAQIRTNHPDIVGPSGEQKTAELNHAYDILSDPAQRRSYDRDRKPATSESETTSTATTFSDDQSTAHEDDDSWSVFQFSVAAKAAWRHRGIGISSLLFLPFMALMYLGGSPGPVLFYPFAVLYALIFGRGKIMYIIIGIGLLFSVNIFAIIGGTLPSWGAIGSVLAAVSIVSTGFFRTSLLRYRKHYAGASLLADIEQAAKNHGADVLIVHAVDGNNVLVESLHDQKQSTIYVWGGPAVGDLIVVNSAGNIVRKAPVSVVSDAMYVLKDSGRL